MEHLYHESRRDRWFRLPYFLILIMTVAGGISYFYDRAAINSYQPPPGTEKKISEYVQRRIAEHEQGQTALQQVPAPVAGEHARTIAAEVNAPAAQPATGVTSRLSNWLKLSDRLQSLTQLNRKWLLASSLLPLLGLVGLQMMRRRRTAPVTAASTPVPAAASPAVSAVKANHFQLSTVVKQEAPEVAVAPAHTTAQPQAAEPALFSLYTQTESVEEGSFIESYLKPTLATCRESLQHLFRRKREEFNTLHLIVPAAIGSRAVTGELTAPELAPGPIFRRAVVKRVA